MGELEYLASPVVSLQFFRLTGYRWISSKDSLIFEIPLPSSSKCFWRMCGILSLSVKRDSSSSSLRFSFSRAENLSSNVAWAFSFAWQYFQRSDYHCNWNTKQFQFFLQQPAFICISMYFVVRQPLIPPRLPTLIMHLESYKKMLINNDLLKSKPLYFSHHILQSIPFSNLQDLEKTLDYQCILENLNKRNTFAK